MLTIGRYKAIFENSVNPKFEALLLISCFHIIFSGGDLELLVFGKWNTRKTFSFLSNEGNGKKNFKLNHWMHRNPY